MDFAKYFVTAGKKRNWVTPNLLFLGAYFLSLVAAMGFFVPLTLQEKYSRSEFVGLVSVLSVNSNQTEVTLKVQKMLKGKPGDEVTLYTGHQLEERDPTMNKGESYLAFLAKDDDGRWCTVQSYMDVYRIQNGMVMHWRTQTSETDEGAETLENVLKQLSAFTAEN